uniref:Uncharacterized protein n=1 Tax=Anguilla anguilla TaxID=7936 RepID=A0A0E9WPT6_ANGAN
MVPLPQWWSYHSNMTWSPWQQGGMAMERRWLLCCSSMFLSKLFQCRVEIN